MTVRHSTVSTPAVAQLRSSSASEAMNSPAALSTLRLFGCVDVVQQAAADEVVVHACPALFGSMIGNATPSSVSQSASRTMTSCATSTRRRVR